MNILWKNNHSVAKAAFVIIIAAIIPISSVAQKVLLKPNAYRLPTGKIVGPEAPKVTVKQHAFMWVVYSDRDDNPTYTSANGSEVKRRLKFMTPAMVIEEEGDFVHIVEYETYKDGRQVFKGISDITIRIELEDYGWIEKSKLLLWESALLTDELYAIKGLSVNTASTLKDVKSQVTQIKDKKLDLYNDPELNTKNENDFRVFDFLFVFKESESSYLVGKLNELKASARRNPEKYVLGWVKKDAIKLWKQRLCLEPNTTTAAIQERKQAGINNTVYLDKESCRKFNVSCQEGDPQSIIWSKSIDSRPKASWRRMPILAEDIQNMNMDMIETGIVTNIFNKSGEEVLSVDEFEEVESGASKMRSDYRSVNVVFVVDGSKGMSPSKFTIRKIISRTTDYFRSMTKEAREDDMQGNKYRLGLVVYRDYSEEDCPERDMLLEKVKLTENYDEVSQFFGEISFTNCVDNDGPQAVKYGLYQAARMFQGKENQSNIIVLIGNGDYRENDERISDTKLVQALSDHSVGLLGFQVSSVDEEGYQEFPLQTNDVLEKTNQLVDAKISEKFPDRKSRGRAQLVDISANILAYDCPESSAIPGAVMMTDPNNPIEVTMLENTITNMVQESIMNKETILSNIDGHIRGQGEKPEMNEGMYHFLSQMDIDLDLLKKASYDNVQLFVEGYVSNTCPKLSEPLYSFSVLLTQSELNELIATLKKLDNPGKSISDKRKEMKNAFRKILEGMFGPKEAKNMIKRMTPADFFARITGLPIDKTALKEVRLSDIQNSRVLSDTDFYLLENKVLASLKDLQRYQADPTNQFKSGDQVLYWVPQSYFP